MAVSARTGSTATPARLADASVVAAAQDIVHHEGVALLQLSRRIDASFLRAVEYLESCRGSVIVSGIGKAGLIAQKIAATLASTGTRSHFLHPAEAVHGDLGRLHDTDVVLLLSQSGETEEIVRLLPQLKRWGGPLLAITSSSANTLGRAATVVLSLGSLTEAGDLQLAPTTSTTAMLALGDALALITSQRRGFTSEDFARYHPAGALGRKLARVQDAMRPTCDCRVASPEQTVRQVLIRVGRPGRRTGAILVTNPQGQLVGIFTDSDLARLLERQQDHLLDEPIGQVMTSHPWSVGYDTMMTEAIDLMRSRKISELPVVRDDGQLLGLLDITDIVGGLPSDWQGESREEESMTKDPHADSPQILRFTNQIGEARVDET